MANGKGTMLNTIKEPITTKCPECGGTQLSWFCTAKASPRAALVKLADLEDNGDPTRLDLLPEPDGQRLRKKYAHAIRFMTQA